MVVIHIQEVNSEQVTEVTARNISLAIRTYAKNAAFDWNSLQNVITGFHGKTLYRRVYSFQTEELTLELITANRYRAVWTNL